VSQRPEADVISVHEGRRKRNPAVLVIAVVCVTARSFGPS
jgi:hypothetical protein